MSKRLEELGAEVARVQDEILADDARRSAVRRRLLTTDSQAAPKARSPRWAPALAWAGAMGAVALAVVLLWPSVPEPIAYRVEGETESRLLDREVAAPIDAPRSIAFTDGSAVRLSHRLGRQRICARRRPAPGSRAGRSGRVGPSP